MIKQLLAAAALTAAASFAQSAPVGIASGGKAGTNYPMVEDVKNMCSTATSPIANVETGGSLDNIDKIYSSPDTQYGIIQADALVFMKGQDPKMMSRIMQVFPLFSTEGHLIVKDTSPIKTLADLQGKTVVEGPENSGSWVTMQVVKSLTGITWKPKLASIAKGFDMVMSGEADAEFINAGKPISILVERKGYRLIPMTHAELDKFALYTKTTISANTYPGQTQSIATFKVDNVMATYAFANQYQKEISDLVGCITKNIGKLQTTGHPKWKDVSPVDIDRIDWPSHPAALAAIKRELKAASKK